MYSSVRLKPDFFQWDGHDTGELRDRIIRDLFGYLGSGECPEDQEPEYRRTLQKFQAESDPEKLKKLIQDYYYELFDAMQFWDADPETVLGDEFPVCREVLGLSK